MSSVATNLAIYAESFFFFLADNICPRSLGAKGSEGRLVQNTLHKLKDYVLVSAGRKFGSWYVLKFRPLFS